MYLSSDFSNVERFVRDIIEKNVHKNIIAKKIRDFASRLGKSGIVRSIVKENLNSSIKNSLLR